MPTLNSCIGFGGSGGGAGSNDSDIKCNSPLSTQNFGGQGGRTNENGKSSKESPYKDSGDFQQKTALFFNNTFSFLNIGDLNKIGHGGESIKNAELESLSHYNAGGGGGGMSSTGGAGSAGTSSGPSGGGGGGGVGSLAVGGSGGMNNAYCGGGGGGGYGAAGGNGYLNAGGGGGGYGKCGTGGHYTEDKVYIESGFAAGAGGYNINNIDKEDLNNPPPDKHYGGNGICLISYYA